LQVTQHFNTICVDWGSNAKANDLTVCILGDIITNVYKGLCVAIYTIKYGHFVSPKFNERGALHANIYDLA
jgi:hypothetical protein